MRFNLLAAAPLGSRRYVFERVEIGLKYSLKPFQRRKYKNNIQRPYYEFPNGELHQFSSSYKKKLTTL